MATSDDASPPTAPTEEPTSGGLSLDDIREMLLALVPEAGEPVRWHDVTGAEYEAPPYASARAQIRLLEILRSALPRVRDSVLSFRALRAEGAGQATTGLAGLSSLMDLLSDPESLAVLERMFVVLHPVAVHRATKNLNLPTGADVGAGDVFSAEEMLRAVLPFSIRPVLSLMDQLAPAGVRLMRVAR